MTTTEELDEPNREGIIETRLHSGVRMNRTEFW